MSESSLTPLGPWTERPLPQLSPEIVPFWDGLRLHEFRLCRCELCGAYYFPYTVCPEHDRIPEFDEMRWIATSGEGRVFAHLVVHRVMDPDFVGEVPYVLALVELDEGPIFCARMVDCRTDDVQVGGRVRVKFHDVPAVDKTLPLFVLADDA